MYRHVAFGSHPAENRERVLLVLWTQSGDGQHSCRRPSRIPRPRVLAPQLWHSLRAKPYGLWSCRTGKWEPKHHHFSDTMCQLQLHGHKPSAQRALPESHPDGEVLSTLPLYCQVATKFAVLPHTKKKSWGVHDHPAETLLFSFHFCTS